MDKDYVNYLRERYLEEHIADKVLRDEQLKTALRQLDEEGCIMPCDKAYWPSK